MRRIMMSAGLIAVVACGSKPKPEAAKGPFSRTTTAAALEALPLVPVTDGRLVCIAGGTSACPTSSATANFLNGNRFAVWEAHHQVQIWSANSPDPMLLGHTGTSDSTYDFVVSIAEIPTGFMVLNSPMLFALRYDHNGKFEASTPYPPVTITHATAYSGSIPFYQVIRQGEQDSAAVFELREIETPGDTLGHTVIKTTLPWLRLHDNRPTGPLPLFPILPSYAIAADSDVVWSAGFTYTVERRSNHGELRWELKSDATGAPTTEQDIAEARSHVSNPSDKAIMAKFDSSRAVTPKFHPAVGALYLARDGRVATAGMNIISRDSVRYILLSNTGEPVGRFVLPSSTHVLLFDGDSVLVQRAGANADLELRWLVVKAPAAH